MNIIDITETDAEYLLTIPPSEKERAKGIRSYTWDSLRRVWVYPRTAKNYDALVAEFGDDLTKVNITRPGRPLEVQSDVKAKLDELNKKLEGIARNGEASKNSQVKALQSAVQGYEKEVIGLREQVNGLAHDADAKTAEANRLAAENARFKNDLESLISEGKKHQSQLKPPTLVFEEVAKVLALTLIDEDGENAQAIYDLQLSETTAIDASKILERILRKTLKADRAASLNDLISQAKDSGILESTYSHLAHTIRVQRNMMAHPDETADESTFLVRSVMSFFALVLLIHELEEHVPTL